MKSMNELIADKAFLSKIMENLMLVRKFEERVYTLFGQGKVYGTTHLGVGEEATGIGSTLALKAEDYMLATHRGHGQAIGKGVDVNAAMAEIMAKEAGVNHGRGGSMHIADIEKGVLGANGILGASGPIGCGAGLYIQMKNIPDRVVAVFFGDGASNEGAMHEAMNLAATWKLPVMFICINNTYGMSMPLAKVVNDTDLTKRAIPYGIKSYEVDGNDVLAVYQTVSAAREYVVTAKEPVFIVEHTYRTSGHSKSDGNLYRSKEEIAWWKERNPVARFTSVLLENGFTKEEIDAIDRKTDKAVEDAVAYAESCEEPALPDIEAAVYAP